MRKGPFSRIPVTSIHFIINLMLGEGFWNFDLDFKNRIKAKYEPRQSVVHTLPIQWCSGKLNHECHVTDCLCLTIYLLRQNKRHAFFCQTCICSF